MVMFVGPPETVKVYQPSLTAAPQVLAGPLDTVFVIVAERQVPLIAIGVAPAQFIPCPKVGELLKKVISRNRRLFRKSFKFWEGNEIPLVKEKETAENGRKVRKN